MEKYQIAAITAIVLGYFVFLGVLVNSDSCTTTIAKTHVERVK